MLINKFKKISDVSCSHLILIFFRRYIFQIVWFGEYGVLYDEISWLKEKSNYAIEFLKPDRFNDTLDVNPYLSNSEIELLKKSNAICIVAKDEKKIIANTWMVPGEQNFFYQELGHRIRISPNDYYSRQTFVNQDYRGKRILAHMLNTFAKTYLTHDGKMWGHIYNWNTSSVKAFQHLGWKHLKNVGFAKLLGIRFKFIKNPESMVGYQKDSGVTSTGYLMSKKK